MNIRGEIMSKITTKYKSITVISLIIIILIITGIMFKGNIYKLSGDAYAVLGKDEVASAYYERAIKNDYGSDIA